MLVGQSASQDHCKEARVTALMYAMSKSGIKLDDGPCEPVG